MPDTAIFDVDGTLVDTNYQHAVAWFRAFRSVDITVPVWRIHRAIGMGGDKLVAHVTDDQVEREHGDELRAAWEHEFAPLLDEVQPFEGAREVLAAVRERGFAVVLASSGKREHVEHYLSLIGGRSIVDGWTTSDDVEASKPEPDLVTVALEAVGGTERRHDRRLHVGRPGRRQGRRPDDRSPHRWVLHRGADRSGRPARVRVAGRAP